MIKLYVIKTKETEEICKEYFEQINRVFECDDDETESVLEEYEKKKSELKNLLEKLTAIAEFSDEYYEEHIEDDKTKMVLSEGMYTPQRVEQLLKNCSTEFKNEVSSLIKKHTRKNILKSCFCKKGTNDIETKLLFWQCGEE